MSKGSLKKITPRQALSLAVDAGDLMLTNGAETYRTEDTMQRLIQKCGYEAETFVTVTGIFVSVKSDGGDAFTLLKRVKQRIYNYDKIVRANDLSRNFADGTIGYKEAARELALIRNVKLPYPTVLKVFASGVSCGCFSFLLSAGIMDCLNSLVVGICCQFIVIKMNRVSPLLVNIIGGAVISVIAILLMAAGLGNQLDKVIIGSVLPMLPGIAFTNSIRDIIEGDLLSGASRLLEAVLCAIGIATGVGVVLQMWIYFGRGYLL